MLVVSPFDSNVRVNDLLRAPWRGRRSPAAAAELTSQLGAGRARGELMCLTVVPPRVARATQLPLQQKASFMSCHLVFAGHPLSGVQPSLPAAAAAPMVDDYSRILARVATAQLAEVAGFDACQDSAVEILAELLLKYISETCSTSHSYAGAGPTLAALLHPLRTPTTQTLQHTVLLRVAWSFDFLFLSFDRF